MTNTIDFAQVKEYIASLNNVENIKEIRELLSMICEKATVYDIEDECIKAIGRVSEGDRMTLKELVLKDYNNVIFYDLNGNEDYPCFNMYADGFSEEQLSKFIEVDDMYPDDDGYTVVVAKELNLKAEEKYVQKLFVPQVHCNKCGGHVLKSLHEDYTYQCLNCDEDLFEFETHIVKDEEKKLTDKVLNELALKAYDLGCVSSPKEDK